jgi:glycine cleavage system H protein
MYPSDRRYSKDFVWIRIEGSQGTVGLTDHAVKLLSPIESVILHAPGRTLKPGGGFGSVEGTKAVSDLLAPMSGVVTDVNVALHQNPKPLQDDPHGTWLIRLTLSDPSKASALLSSTEFEALVNPPPKPKKPKKTRPAPPPSPPPASPPTPPRPAPQPPAATEVEKTIRLFWSMQLRDSRLQGGDDAFGERDYSGGGSFSWRERSISFTTVTAAGGGLDRRYQWRDTRHLRVSAGGMSNTTTSHTDYAGSWSIEVVAEKPYLVMQDGERGRLRFTLAEGSGGGILLDGRPYTRRRI